MASPATRPTPIKVEVIAWIYTHGEQSQPDIYCFASMADYEDAVPNLPGHMVVPFRVAYHYPANLLRMPATIPFTPKPAN